MLLSLSIEEKSFATKLLFQSLSLTISEGEKVATIGRNGVGKTTLFNMIAGLDHDYTGLILIKKGIRVLITAQEHFGLESVTALDYILQSVPQYFELLKIIETYPQTMGEDLKKISHYFEALQTFADFDYYTVQDRIIEALEPF